jgi:hypothetical protein
MRNCLECNKKLKWGEGYFTSDGEFCKDCYFKRKEIVNKLEEEEKEEKIIKEKQYKESEEKDK